MKKNCALLGILVLALIQLHGSRGQSQDAQAQGSTAGVESNTTSVTQTPTFDTDNTVTKTVSLNNATTDQSNTTDNENQTVESDTTSGTQTPTVDTNNTVTRTPFADVTTEETNPSSPVVDISTKSQPPKSTPSPGPALSPIVLVLLQQVDSFIPGFSKAVNIGALLSPSQTKMVNDFAMSLLPSVISGSLSPDDILKAAEKSGLIDAIAKQAGLDPEIPGIIKAVCQEKFLNSIQDKEATVGALMNLTKTGGNNLKRLAAIKAKDLPAFCASVPQHSVAEWKECQEQLSRTATALTEQDQWALSLLDASAKPGSSILRANLHFMGNYKQCQKVYFRDPALKSPIEGNVCQARIKIPLDGAAQMLRLLIPDPRLKWDICLPKSCLDIDLNAELFKLSMGDVTVSCNKDVDITSDGGAIVAIAVLSLFGLLLVAGTVMELYLRASKSKNSDGLSIINGYAMNGPATTNGHSNGIINRGLETGDEKMEITTFSESNEKVKAVENGLYSVALKNSQVKNPEQQTDHPADEKKGEKEEKIDIASLAGWQRILLAFSLPRNTEKILSVRASPGSIGCLHGIRVLSMGWVILGHVFLYCASSIKNLAVFADMIETLPFQIIINAPLSVDSFFVLSGFLTCFVFLKTIGKKGKITLKETVLYYVHRYWRLTPPLAVWIMVVACLAKYMPLGRPGSTRELQFVSQCKENWWVNLLYINNLYKRDESCLGQTWYLASDMQFYVLAPLALIPWAYGKKVIGFVAASLYIICHIASTVWLEIKYDATQLHNGGDYRDHIYFKSYTRAAPFAIGMMLAWVVWRTKSKVTMNKYVVGLCWFLCLGVIVVLNLVTYDEYQDMSSFYWTAAGRNAFETLQRPLWALALSWVIFACVTGYGGYVNSILSWEGWLPLSRLTYSAFLVHITLLKVEHYVPEYTRLLTMTSVSYSFLGTFVMSYAVGYLLTVVVESPMMALEKILLR